jgi:hypothetical protein
MNLGGKDNIFTFSSLKRLTDNLLASTSPDFKVEGLMPVYIGSVNKIDTCFQGLMDDTNRIFFILSPAKIHTAQA